MSKETIVKYMCDCKRIITIKGEYDKKADIVRIFVTDISKA